MNGKIKKLFMISGYIFCLTFTYTAIGASQDYPVIIAENLRKNFNTTADAVVLQDKITVKLLEDGRVVENRKRIVKLLSDFAVDEYADPRISFNSAYQKLDIISAYTVTPQGKRVDSGQNAKNLSTPEEIAKFPHFSDIQELVVTHVGVERGAITVLEYEISDTKPWRDFFYGKEFFSEGSDINEKILEIRIPEGKEIAWKAYNFQPAFKRTEDGKIDVYTFSVSNVSAINPAEVENDDFDADEVLPVLFYTEKISETGFVKSILKNTGIKDASFEQCREEGKEILKTIEKEMEEKSDIELEEAIWIFKRIADKIATVKIFRDIFGWQLRSPQDAFFSGYADSLEKLRILFCTFESAGYETIPIVTLKRVDEMKLHPDNISGFWVRVNLKGLYLYFPSSGSLQGGEPKDGESFIIGSDGLSKASFVSPLSTMLKLNFIVDLRKGKMRFEGTLHLRGKVNPYWEMLVSEKKIEPVNIIQRFFNNNFLKMENVCVKRLALDESVFTFEGKVEQKEGEVDLNFGSPYFSSNFEKMGLFRQSRTTPLKIKEKETEIMSFAVLLPEKGEVIYFPEKEEKFETKGKGVELKITKNLLKTDGKIKLERKLKIEPATLTPEEYIKFREMLSEGFSPDSFRIIVKIPLE